ncbi:hypothetical protein HaLaN_28466 [Haematococcus lacustris]|uniref:Uncharacterized protein n=1 Tax=Haematococcus lacustris TaxID=44745 RepID=A0A6A0ABW8_HAELA|nr:hypothetical protein HaLaN_28466 [Haematococcus lacustris]
MQVDTGLSFNAIPKGLKGSFAVMAPGASEDIALTVTEGQAREARGTGYCALARRGRYAAKQVPMFSLASSVAPLARGTKVSAQAIRSFAMRMGSIVPHSVDWTATEVDTRQGANSDALSPAVQVLHAGMACT